jgi:hypothetical protein
MGKKTRKVLGIWVNVICHTPLEFLNICFSVKQKIKALFEGFSKYGDVI